MKFKITRIVLLLFLLLTLNCTQKSTTDIPPEIRQALKEFDSEFDSSFSWWAKVYDPKSGGFFYSLSAKNNPQQFAPFIEATSKGVNVLAWTGALDDASGEFKNGIINYFHKRQDPASGFFKDPQYIGQYSQNALQRSHSMAIESLEMCGGKPFYALPHERIEVNREAKQHYAHLQSEQALTKWLDNLPWERRIWTAGAEVLAQSDNFQQLPEPEKTMMLNTAAKYLSARQAENGFWIISERRNWQSELSGSYKILSFLDQNTIPLPRVDTLKHTVLDHLFNKEYTGLIVLYNTVNMLSIVGKHTGGYDDDLKKRIINRCTQIISTLHGPDGGFVTTVGEPTNNGHGLILGERVVESNSDATGLAHKTRMLLHKMVTGNDKPPDHPQVIDFLEAVSK